MRIIDVKAYPLRLPLRSKNLPASVVPSITPVIVKVSTDEGINGAGEAYGFACAPITAKAVEAGLRPILVGKDPLQIHKLWEELYRVTFHYGRAGVMLAAIGGVEIALWDIAGKARNVPVYQMLGGRSHDKLRAYASLLRYPNPEDVAQACAAMKERGYSAIKLHEIDVKAVAAARGAVGDDVDLMLDVNCPWEVSRAIEMGRQFEQFDPYWYEEPIWPGDNYESLAEVRLAVDIPIAAGENEYTARGFRNLLTARAVDFIQPSAFKLGGILQEKKVFTLAEFFEVKVAPHCWSLGPALAATLHISFSEPACEMVETSPETPEAHILTEPLAPEQGFWKMHEKPGLGIELDEDVLVKYQMTDGEGEPSFWSR
jgi:L-alanine-DL-glutamate epimerase-like enolase superfamily enzyme